MKHPDHVRECIAALERVGFSAYSVGGAVRDSIMGREPADWDVATSALPEQMLSVFADYTTIPTGLKHGTLTVLFPVCGSDVPIEITTYRIDGEYRDLRHPESVTFTSDICADLARRDLTVNAMAFNEASGLVDPFGGRADIERRLIRTVGDARVRFSEDALRILRTFRFAAQLGFSIDGDTLAGAEDCVGLLRSVARERIWVELKKLFSSPNCVHPLKMMLDCGAWWAIFPEFPDPDTEQLERIGGICGNSFAPRVAVAISHLTQGERAELLASLHPSTREKKLIEALCELYLSAESMTCGDSCAMARRILAVHGEHIDDAVSTLALRLPENAPLLSAIESERTRKSPLALADLAIHGDAILPLCGNDRRAVGKTLSYLLDAVLDDPALNEPEILIRLAAEYLGRTDSATQSLRCLQDLR